jgi:hypothetical protein
MYDACQRFGKKSSGVERKSGLEEKEWWSKRMSKVEVMRERKAKVRDQTIVLYIRARLRPFHLRA